MDSLISNPKKIKRLDFAQKVYLVFLRSQGESRKQPHEMLIDVCLSRKEADDLTELHPGAYVHRFLAKRKNRGLGGPKNGNEGIKSDADN